MAEKKRSRAVKDAPDLPEPDRIEGARHPRETMSLHGHGAAEAAIAATFASGRIPHAWLLGGPEGIGKATLAYRMARALLSSGSPGPRDTLAADPDDPAVLRVVHGVHPDLFVLRRPADEKTGKLKTVITVDEVRRLHGFLTHHASAGGWRVALVDAADDMNRNAANALLKVLEEPPARTLLVLIAHAPARLLPTIRSRCRKVVLNPLDGEAVAAVLAEQGCGVAPDKAPLVAMLAEGSAGKAFTLASGNALALYEEMTGLLARLPDIDPAALHGFAEKACSRTDETVFTVTIGLLEGWLARLIRTGACGPGATSVAGRVEEETLVRIAARRPLDDWIAAWDKIRESFAAGVPLNLDRKQLLLTAFFTLQATARG